jgi:sensor histidine kinase YesM
MEFLILSYTFSFVDAALLLYFESRLLKNIKAGWKTIIFSLVLITAIDKASEKIFGNVNALATIIMIISTGIIYKLIFEEKLLNIYLIYFLGILSLFIAESIVILAILPFGIRPMQIQDSFIAFLVVGIISKSIYYIFVRYSITKMKFPKNISKTLTYQIVLICIFNTIIIFMTYWFYKHTDIPMIRVHMDLYIMLCTFGALTFSIFILDITRGISEQSQKEADWLVREVEYKNHIFYVDNIQDMLKSMQAQRHDFNNHINCIYGLLQLKKPDEARKYIDRLAEEALVFSNLIDTGNPVLSSLLNTKIAAAERDRIQLQTDIRLPETITIEPIDISIIIGNLLDNALEACAVLEGAEKNIKLEVYTNNNNFYIKVKNSKSEQIITDAANLESRFTNKPDTANHGFGLFNIKKTVNKYGGIFKFEDKGDCFLSDIEIPMKS